MLHNLSAEHVHVAYKLNQEDNRFSPCHIKDIRKGDLFYLVTDGVSTDICSASSNAYYKFDNGDATWIVESEIYE